MPINFRDESLDQFRKRCKENNLKVTPQRIIIYRELLRSDDHPNAEALHKRITDIIPDISLATVNRTLLTFNKIGLIKNVEGYGEPRRYDPKMETHHHFRCLNCNSIIDFDYKPYDDIIIPAKLKKSYSILSKKVLLEGYCDKCRKSR